VRFQLFIFSQRKNEETQQQRLQEKEKKMDIVRDKATIEFASAAIMEDSLRDMHAAEKWEEAPSNEIKVGAIKNAPLLIEEEKRAHNFRHDVSDLAIEDTMVESELLVTTRESYSLVDDLLRETAVSGVLERAGISGRAIREFKAQGKQEILASIINECLQLWGGKKAKILYRGEKVSAMHGERYLPFQQADLLHKVSEFSDAYGGSFLNGAFTHGYTNADYSLDPSRFSAAQRNLSDAGIELSTNWSPKISFGTSDNSLAAATAMPKIETGGISLPLGSSIKVYHRISSGIKTSEDGLFAFGQGLNGIFKLLEDGFDSLVRIAGIRFNPADAESILLRIAEEVKEISASEIKEEMAALLLSGQTAQTAFDVFFVLSKAAEKIKNIQSRVNAEETLARILMNPTYNWTWF